MTAWPDELTRHEASVTGDAPMTECSPAPAKPPRDKRDAALGIAREALRQIARDHSAARPTAYFVAKARFALDRIEELLR